MLNEEMRRLLDASQFAFVASADETGKPHLAAGQNIRAKSDCCLVFDAWFCHTTMENVANNPRVAVAVTDPATARGFQFSGRVESKEETAVLDGFIPGKERTGIPQVQYRLVIRIDEVLEFSTGIHSDQPL